MPEGPEVKKIVDQLKKEIEGSEIKNIKVISGRYLNDPIKGHDQLNYPIKVVDILCKGKFIAWKLSKNISLWNTLGMTGTWSFKKTKHSRIKIDLVDGRVLYFNDVRNFGTVKFAFKKETLEKRLTSLGPDLLTEHIDDEAFYNIIKSSPLKQICQILMDQTKISGVGNYIKAESLYLSKINPTRLCGTLTFEEIKLLKESIKTVMTLSYNNGGASIKDYKDINGNEGKFVDFMKVYGKKKDPDGNLVIKTTTADGRTTHWVPLVQK